VIEILDDLGNVLHAAGEPEEARAMWQRALHLAERLSNPDVDHIKAKVRGS
jgi:hypothetical protein